MDTNKEDDEEQHPENISGNYTVSEKIIVVPKIRNNFLCTVNYYSNIGFFSITPHLVITVSTLQ